MSDTSHSHYPKAGLMRRLAALLYDSFLVAAIWMLIGFCIQLLTGPETNQLIDGRVQTDPTLSRITFALMVISASSFYVWFWTKSGQTLGMVSWRLKVVSEDGSLLSVPQAILRFLLAWPAFFFFGAGYLWMYLDSSRDALHDKYSRSIVVVVPKSHRPFD